MSIALLYIINFVIIFSLITLIINKYSKYKINKSTINENSYNHLEKIHTRFNYIVMGLNLIYLFFNVYFKSDSLIMMIVIPILTIIDIIAVILLGVFAKLQSSFKK